MKFWNRSDVLFKGDHVSYIERGKEKNNIKLSIRISQGQPIICRLWESLKLHFRDFRKRLQDYFGPTCISNDLKLYYGLDSTFSIVNSKTPIKFNRSSIKLYMHHLKNFSCSVHIFFSTLN